MTVPDTITIAANSIKPLKVKRLGYGTMRLTGEGFYGEPKNRPEALEILKQAIKSGVNFLDTADYYGEDVTNRLIAEAIYPYNDDLVICTKVGATRKPDKSWIPFNSPANIRTSIENNLRTLKQEQITLVHFRILGGKSETPYQESMEAMFKLQEEGKILHVGISNVSVEQLETVMKMGEIATVENMFGHAQRTTLVNEYGVNSGGEVLDICEANGIPLIPYFSLQTAMGQKDERIAKVAEKHNASEAQINIAWLLHHSPWILPIPGTSSLKHFEENLKAAEIKLDAEDMEFLK